jgi:hypothetical protein
MKISVHQPHYHPWIGYFNKIAASDIFVYLDNVQYKKREFQNRNKIRTNTGWSWITVPVVTKGKYFQPISRVEIDNSDSWTKSHWELIKSNYRKSKHFAVYEDYFEQIYSTKWERLIDLNVAINKYLFEAFDVDTKVVFESALDISATSTERIIQICKVLKADEYITGQGANSYLDQAEFEEAGIKLTWQKFSHPEYEQVYEGFEPYMSAVDFLFNCGKDCIDIIKTEAYDENISNRRSS